MGISENEKKEERRREILGDFPLDFPASDNNMFTLTSYVAK